MGGGTFGVEAASEFYFGKSVKDVSLAEAAMLAGLFKAPTRFAPHINLPAARARANEVLTNMVQAGFLTEGQVIGARRHPADVIEQSNADDSPDYFLDWAFDKLKEMSPPGDRVLTVRTTIDLGMQHAAEDAIVSTLRQYGAAFNVKQAALVGVEPDGAVRAMVGGRDYGESQFNRATDALRQPGSSFKPFVYATAMMNGFTPKSVVADAPICIGNWCPKNYSGGLFRPDHTHDRAGQIDQRDPGPPRASHRPRQDRRDGPARWASPVNCASPGRCRSGRRKSRWSIWRARIPRSPMVATRRRPTPFTQIINGQGDIVYDRRRDAPKPERVLDDKTVAAMNSMLVQVPEWGTGRRAKLDGIRTAGKTGTTSAYRDAWFVGFTGNYVAAVWFGNDGYAPTRRLTGGVLPAQTWHDFMTYAHQGVALKPIPFVDPAVRGEPPRPP